VELICGGTRVVLDGGTGLRAAQPPVGPMVPLGLTLDEATRREVAAIVEACDGDEAEAARRLDVGRDTIGRIQKGEREGLAGDRESRPGDEDV